MAIPHDINTAAAFEGRDCLLVKWQTPQDELNGFLRTLTTLLEIKAFGADNVAFIMPNEVWAKQMDRALRAVWKQPTWKILPDKITIKTYWELAELSDRTFHTVFCPACISGFFPTNEALDAPDGKLLREQADIFIRVANLARARTVFSYFVKTDEGVAKSANMRTTRTKEEHGYMMSMVRPSEFFADAGNCCPPSIGGQSFLRDLHIN